MGAGERRVKGLVIGKLILLLGLAWAGVVESQVPAPEGADGVDPVDDPEPEIEVRNPPAHPTPVAADFGTGIWEWDREGLQSTRSLTLVELLEEVPGVIALRGGDHGQPASVTAFGVGAGRVRVFLDGVELPPLDGGGVDLSRVGLAGLERVRVERRPGDLRIELEPLRLFEPRPYTLLEVGTGDLNTNLFRGTFAHPAALGGNVVVSLDRIDTEGPLRNEPGASFGAHIRHNLFRSDGTAVAWEFRTMTARRPPGLWSPRNLSRTDLALHGRRELAPGLLLGVFAQRSWAGVDYGRGVTPPAEPEVNEGARNQLGARVSVERELWWGEASGRGGSADGWPGASLELRGGVRLEGIGAASVSAERQWWSEAGGTLALHARAWTEPRFGFTLFAEAESGTRGVPFRLPPEPGEEDADDPGIGDPPLPPPDGNGDGPDGDGARIASVTDRTGLRAGVEYRRGGLELGAAVLRVSADSLHPAGFAPDAEGVVIAAGDPRNGVELSGRIPLRPILPGLGLTGHLQFWDEPEGSAWRYLPRASYEGRLAFHDVFLESGNLEVWGDVGVRGRDSMFLPFEAAAPGDPFASIRSQQSWFVRLQVRVVSVRVFVLWDNVTVRDRNQDFPDRLLPHTRALYGIRWTLWN